MRRVPSSRLVVSRLLPPLTARLPPASVAALLTAFLLAAPVLAADPPTPRVVAGDEWVVLAGLPRVLDDPEIRRQLDSGLTTTFRLRVELRTSSGPVQGGGRVEVRFEPWDEIYELAAIGVDVQPIRGRATSFPELVRLWSGLRLPVLPRRLAGSWRSGPPRMRLDLEVIPFSQQEQQETQRWFSESMDEAQGGTAEGAGSVAEDRSEALADVLDLLLATSIQRRPLFAWRWQVAVALDAPR